MIEFSPDEARAWGGFVYLGTPYSKFPAGIEEAFREAARAAAYLVRMGIGVYSPVAHTHPVAVYGALDPFDHRIWLPADRPMMEAAAGLVIVGMATWQDSTGLKHEIEVFEKAGKPVRFLPWGDASA